MLVLAIFISMTVARKKTTKNSKNGKNSENGEYPDLNLI